ncbi:MAG: GTP-binding protein [Promethearchaeota archaeon]
MVKQERLEELMENLMEALPTIEAAAIVDRNGLIIYSKLRNPESEDDILGTVTAVFDSFIDRLKLDFGSAGEFLNVMKVDQNKFMFASAGPNAIVTFLTNLTATDNELRVYGHHIAEKVKILLQDQEIHLTIPPVLALEAHMRGGRLPEGSFQSKVIILGDPLVGKTSLIRRFVDNKFGESYVSTIGVDISRKLMKLSEQSSVNLSLWDVGGQAQNMSPYRKRFYQGANFAFLVFDITRKKTFDNLKTWIDDLNKSVERRVPIMIIGNKIDIEEHEISNEEIEEKAENLKCPFILTSAKTSSNVNDAFTFAAYKFLENL